MRFHKAIQITGLEASFLMLRDPSAPARAPVVSFDGIWYDVRTLSTKELASFLDDLARARRARGFTPH
jgi:hypothetical protein